MSQPPPWIGPPYAAPEPPARGRWPPAPRRRRIPPSPAAVAMHRHSRCLVALASAVLFGAAPAPLVAQKPRPKRPPAAAPADTTARRTDSAATAQDSLTRFLESFSLRNLGPAAYSGRVTALAVPHTTGPAKTLYIGAAGGAFRFERRVGGDGGEEQPALAMVGRRRLQVHRRRREVDEHGLEGHALDRPRGDPPDQPRDRVRRGPRPPLGHEPRARHLQDHRR